MSENILSLPEDITTLSVEQLDQFVTAAKAQISALAASDAVGRETSKANPASDMRQPSRLTTHA